MEIKLITENKKDFLDLLLLADEQENMIDKYLERGDLFALCDGDLKGVCVVTDEGSGTFEVQNVAVYEKHHRQGYASKLMRHIFDYYKGKGGTMIVGTGDVPKASASSRSEKDCARISMFSTLTRRFKISE